ncbi:endonuclease [Shewanella sp. 5_MG-2023]|uniref:endonuclease n=1 Tax=Shewanella sp. 5_MG-2023 TaxID=3062656 RepID=UPI0026E16760|nr:endonuclease [Shewanella sp. 5_MG-2023]MDO6638516.1 endonuclease [Shewanella sp. 5_MG-2023]
MNNKITSVAKAITLLLATASTAAYADLVITEYVEGSSNNKAIEISNLGDSNIDLDAAQYVLTLYSNGATEPGNTAVLTGNLAAGSSIVYHNAGADEQFKVGIESTVTYFNGDDALVLTKDGATIDRVGKLGERPDGAWTDPNDPDFSTKDKTLRRKASITTGDTDASADFPGANNQWVVFEKDTADGLGCPGEGACVAESGVLIITEYIEGSSNNKAIELSNVGGSAIDLDAAQYKLTLYANGATEPGNSETLSGMLAAGESIVFYNSGAADEFKVGTESTVTYFNGDDALMLTKDDVVIDRIGKLGERPDGAWTDPNDPDFSTKDKTLRRKASITAGDSDAYGDFPGTNNQWITFDIDTADGLGCMGEVACGDTPVDPEPDPTPCNNCVELTPVADPDAFEPNVYYTDVLSGSFDDAEAMKDAISITIANGHQQLSYKEVWTALTYSDEDPANRSNVIELYTGNSISKQNNSQGANAADEWNREHVWAKSHGFPSESQLGYTDAHHLRPTNVKVNSTRSNYDFAECGDTATEIADAPGNFVDSSGRCFEPRDEVKGDVARMIMYMDTRYQGNDSNMPDLIAVDRMTTSDEVSNNEPLHGKLCTLYAWHHQDPVDDADVQRNDAIYTYQGNRNPYIDYPEWVQAVYGEQCDDPLQPELDVDVIITAPESVNEGEAFIIDASETVVKDEVELSFNWEQTAGPELEFDASSSILALTAPEVTSDTPLQFTLTVSDGTLETTQAVSVTVVNVPLAFDISFSGNTELNEGDSTVITAAIANEPEGLQYSWTQISGMSADYTADGLVLNVTAPDVDVDQTLVFTLFVSDGEEQYSTNVSIDVKNQQESGWSKPDGAGSLGAGLLMLLPLLWRRRQS